MLVYRNSIELVRIVHREVVPALRRAGDRELADQLHRAVRSVVLNIAERGKRRGSHFSIALGSARETHACLELGAALGMLPESLALDALLDRSDHIQAMLWKLSRV